MLFRELNTDYPAEILQLNQPQASFVFFWRNISQCSPTLSGARRTAAGDL